MPKTTIILREDVYEVLKKEVWSKRHAKCQKLVFNHFVYILF